MSTIKLVLHARENNILSNWNVDIRDGMRVLTHDALKEDDPHFSDLLDKVLVEGDESGEVVLSGSIAEAILEGWNEYISLYDWMKKTGEPYITYDMSKSLGKKDGNLRNRRMPLVDYDRILLLTQVLNMPDYWEMCTISRDNLTHLEIVGRQVIEKLSKYFPDNPGRYNVQDGEVSLYLIAKAIVGSGEDSEKYMIALYGALRMATLSHSSDKIYLGDIVWKDALDLLDRLGVNRTREYNTIAILAGKGSPSNTVNWPSWSSLVPLSEGNVLQLPMHKDDVEYLYSTTLRLFPDDVSPLVFGLDAITEGLGRVTQGVNDLMSIVPIRHNVALRSVEHYAEALNWKISEDDKERLAAANSALLLGELGNEGTRRILLSILHGEERGMGSATSQLYAEELEKALAGEGEAPEMDGGVTETNLVKALLYITQK